MTQIILIYGFLLSFTLSVNCVEDESENTVPKAATSVHISQMNEEVDTDTESNKVDSNKVEVRYPPGIPQTIYERRDMEEDYSDEEEEDINNVIVPEKASYKDIISSGEELEPAHDHDHEHHTTVNLKISGDKSEQEHLKQHLEVPSMDTSKMSEQELAFHYFRVHDTDHNQKLDGLELIKFLMHYHEHEEGEEAKIFSDEELIESVEHALGKYDKDNDGYIDYGEFKKSTEPAQQEVYV